MQGWFVSPEYRTFRCIAGKARPGYLAPLVRTEWFWTKLAGATRGVGARRERTRPEAFLKIEIPIPEYQIQEQGERLFFEIDRIAHLQAASEPALNAMMPAILDRAFKGEL
jgi:type I restriction enzyme S subunit